MRRSLKRVLEFSLDDTGDNLPGFLTEREQADHEACRTTSCGSCGHGCPPAVAVIAPGSVLGKPETAQ